MDFGSCRWLDFHRMWARCYLESPGKPDRLVTDSNGVHVVFRQLCRRTGSGIRVVGCVRGVPTPRTVGALASHLPRREVEVKTHPRRCRCGYAAAMITP